MTTSTTPTLAGNDALNEKHGAQSPPRSIVRDSEDALIARPAHPDQASQHTNEDEYPKGMQLGFIIAALVLSVFLLALDMVSFLLLFDSA